MSKRDFSSAVCPACGLHIANRQEIPFLTRRTWRNRVADSLGYDREFIKNLGEKTRIHRHHFDECDVRNDKPVGLPQFNIIRVPGWPAPGIEDIDSTNTGEKDSGMDVDENKESVDSSLTDQSTENIIVELKQLKKLLHQCYICGNGIVEGSMNFSVRGGVFFANYSCSKCKKKRFWRSNTSPLTQLVTGASLASGIGVKQMLNFFTLLQCAFPTRSALFCAARQVVRPIIGQFFESEQTKVVDGILKSGEPVHLCMDGQYNSPKHSAHHYTVTAIESQTNKIIGFQTVKRSETNNCSADAEPMAFRLLLNRLMDMKFPIFSVTTDNNSSLNELFANEYPNLRHFLDLWHILRNIYRKLAPKFNNHQVPNLKSTYSTVSRHIWKCGSGTRMEYQGDVMLEKCLSSLFHIVGIHNWQKGRFVDVFNSFFAQNKQFPAGRIQKVYMSSILSCDHGAQLVTKPIDPFSLEFDMLVDELCTDSRLEQLNRAANFASTSLLASHHSLCMLYRPNRYHYWYTDTCNMMAVLHHNTNIDAELRGDRVIERRSIRLDRGNEASERVHKTVLLEWQKRLMSMIMEHTEHLPVPVANDKVEILEEFDDALDDFNDVEDLSFLEFDDELEL